MSRQWICSRMGAVLISVSMALLCFGWTQYVHWYFGVKIQIIFSTCCEPNNSFNAQIQYVLSSGCPLNEMTIFTRFSHLFDVFHKAVIPHRQEHGAISARLRAECSRAASLLFTGHGSALNAATELE